MFDLSNHKWLPKAIFFMFICDHACTGFVVMYSFMKMACHLHSVSMTRQLILPFARCNNPAALYKLRVFLQSIFITVPSSLLQLKCLCVYYSTHQTVGRWIWQLLYRAPLTCKVVGLRHNTTYTLYKETFCDRLNMASVQISWKSI